MSTETRIVEHLKVTNAIISFINSMNWKTASWVGDSEAYVDNTLILFPGSKGIYPQDGIITMIKNPTAYELKERGF